ncbi:hypothetical protein LP316_09975 [Thalassotalea sp. LPB0316]|uniref:CsiV family protein n=1 Tax=Thalassotalea sp. LPB0316 TaxID=2769490 RepID=UPI001865DCEE|nr:CsiV family protein [Thalassotalea sp. LPB0316]QOL24669.1 hypothetical protein LP316_09975 [Thalassotalea sp. LPB0316]
MKLTQSLSFALIGALSFAPNAIAQQAKQRWFEIEVILFSQLGDKSALKEDFAIELPPVKLNRPRDLLTPHINPDLTAVKALVPVCGDNYPAPLIESQSILTTEFSVLNLEDIDQRELSADEVFDFQQRDQQFIDSSIDNVNLSSGLSTEGYQAVESIDDLFAQENSPLSLVGVAPSDGEEVFVSSLTPEEQAQLQTQVAQAQAYFDAQQFSYDFSLPQEVCLLSDEVIAQLKQANSKFDPDYFALDVMPSKILRYQDIYSQQPYLLNDDSLELHDIVVQLRRSKNFKPLMHLGWRQPAVSKRRSRPMRLFAGENLKYAHEQAMQAYQQAVQEREALALALTLAQENQLIEGEQNNLVREQDVTAAITHPFSTIIDTLKRGDISAQQALADTNQTLAAEDEVDNKQLVMPVAPDVDWTIDGLFNVHLNHYLYITAEFNIANKSLAEHETALLTTPESKIEAIRFSQNRRVISQEVHYFDHPYMGMIVQIRRYKVPTKPFDANQ